MRGPIVLRTLKVDMRNSKSFARETVLSTVCTISIFARLMQVSLDRVKRIKQAVTFSVATIQSSVEHGSSGHHHPNTHKNKRRARVGDPGRRVIGSSENHRL